MPGMGALIGGASLVIMLLVSAIGFLGNALIDSKVETVIATERASSEQALRDLENAFAEQSKENALMNERDKSNLLLQNERLQNDLDQRILQANHDAEKDSVTFGDDFIRRFARSMCIIELGKSARQSEAREACNIRAATFDTATVDFTTTYNSTNLRRWTDACDARRFVVPDDTEIEDDGRMWESEWVAEYPEILPEMCLQSVVAFTPEAALMFEKYFLRVENYTTGLNMDIDVRDQAIEIITNPPDSE